jgi:cytochrome b561
MMKNPTPAARNSERYSAASIILHWLMLVLIVGVYAAIELRELFPKGSDPREAMKTWHFMLGLSVLGLVWVRIAARLIWPAPKPARDTPQWRHVAAAATHMALYVLMIGMPLAGWAILSAEGEAIPFFGLELPPLIGKNDALAERVEEIHEFGGTMGYWLIGLHAAASVFHQLVLRDRLLGRMLPIRA